MGKLSINQTAHEQDDQDPEASLTKFVFLDGGSQQAGDQKHSNGISNFYYCFGRNLVNSINFGKITDRSLAFGIITNLKMF